MADMILNKVYDNNNYQILTPNGFKDFRGLITGRNRLIEIVCNNTSLKCTPKHKLFNKSGLIYAEECKLGEYIFCDKGYEQIIDIHNFSKDSEVFELLEVDGDHTYISNKIVSSQCLVLDEFAFVPTHVAEEFIASVYPTISSGKDSKIIMISTPNGMNHFHQFWKNAIAGTNTFKPIKVDWWEIPGRDEKWRQRTISDIGITRYRSEFSCAFIGSTQTLVDAEVLERSLMEYSEPVDVKYSGLLKIYEEPIKDALYIMGVDSAGGTGGDYAVIQVLKVVEENDVEQVAVYACNTISYGEFAQVVIGVSNYYNDCYMIVENNEIGGHVANTIWNDYEYDKILNTEHNKIGTNSNIKTKLSACLNLKKYMEAGWLKVHDRRTLEELSSYEEVSPNVFRGAKNTHDDHVSALYWALYFFKTNYYDGRSGEMSSLDKRFILETKKNDEDDMSAPPVIADSSHGEMDSDGFVW